MKKTKPELVCPAGDWPSLITAVESGADSIYFGVRGVNMRAKASNFDSMELKKVMAYLHKNGKKGFLALNVVVMNSELEKIENILKEAKNAGVDAVILWDMAVLSIAKRIGLNIHISTQASISNIEALKFYASLGAERAVLSRESTLEDIEDILRHIREEELPVEIETFIHGAMCVSISGRCFLSSLSWGKSANRGECRQSCRREFEIRDKSGEAEYIVGKDYLLSPKDLNTILFIDELVDAGIHSFKIEGRMRSLEYVKVVVSSYREAIDLHFENKLDKEKKQELMEKLSRVYNRGFSEGFYFGEPSEWISRKLQHRYEKIFAGEVIKFYNKINVAEILMRSGKISVGDELFITGRNTPAEFMKVEELQQEHKVINSVVKGELAGLKTPFRVRKGDQIYIWREKEKYKKQ
ncbi:MAG: peptidase U32 family protein [Acidobacteriota bacterium]